MHFCAVVGWRWRAETIYEVSRSHSVKNTCFTPWGCDVHLGYSQCSDTFPGGAGKAQSMWLPVKRNSQVQRRNLARRPLSPNLPSQLSRSGTAPWHCHSPQGCEGPLTGVGGRGQTKLKKSCPNIIDINPGRL